MEISKALQEEISSVQNKLKNAIRDHQICVGKLKNDPNNTDILTRIHEIQVHIVSLGRWQKQVVQRLRKEVELYKAANANGTKVSVAALLGLNNNNHITNNNESRRDVVVDEKDLNGLDDRSSKEDYEEEVVRNDDVPSPVQNNAPPKSRSTSVETLSGDDDVIEVSVDNSSNEKQEEEEDDNKSDSYKQLSFLEFLGLITTSRCAELQNRRAERKRRSTANPQFVYTNWELPLKRKRHSYLQSSGNAIQTRQTTARLNGPSPPPSKNSPKTSASTKATTKSLIPSQKATNRPNILRNVLDSKVLGNKERQENGINQMHVTDTKPAQISESETVHIPGLPSGLTISKIQKESMVCVCCRGSGFLYFCKNCKGKYHAYCHSVSPAPPNTCPRCVSNDSESAGIVIKKENELAAAAYTPRPSGETGEDSEIHKTAGRFHKNDTAEEGQFVSSILRIGQLPSSTFLIPLSSDTVPGANDNKSDVASYDKSKLRGNIGGSSQSKNHQSYFIVKKVPIKSRSKAAQSEIIAAKEARACDIKPDPKVDQSTESGGNNSGEPAPVSSDDCSSSEAVSIGGERGTIDEKRGNGSEVSLVHLDDNDDDDDDNSSSDSNRPDELSAKIVGSEEELTGKYDANLLREVFTGGKSSDNVGNNQRQSHQGDAKERRTPASEANEFTGGQRVVLSEFTEHVKLEEAHLPAPLRARLATRDEQNAVDYGKVTVDKKSMPCRNNSELEDIEEVVVEVSKSGLHFANNPEDQEESASAFELQDLEFLASMRESQAQKIAVNDFNAFERAYGAEEKTAEEDDGSRCSTSHDLIELRSVFTVPEDKADNENQDLLRGSGCILPDGTHGASTVKEGNTSAERPAYHDLLQPVVLEQAESDVVIIEPTYFPNDATF